MFTIRLNDQQGFHPGHFIFNQTAKPLQTGTTSLSQSAGAVWGEQVLSPLVFYPVLRISCQFKGNLQSHNSNNRCPDRGIHHVVDCVPVMVS
jgi:hypothetical protein